MELVSFFLKGVAAGFVVAAPVGPVGVLCVRRTLVQGPLSGCVTGLGAAIADTFYVTIAAFGIGFIATFLLANEFWFRVVGGVILCVMALNTFLSKPLKSQGPESEGLTGDFLSALIITGTNPLTLIAFGVILTSIGIASAGGNIAQAEILIAGVFIGSLMWWGTLTGISHLFRGTLGQSGMRWINRISAAIVLLSGVLILISVAVPEGPIARLFRVPLAG
jgi:threonine/homoserine/homoserine lactone efflux protein